MLADKGNTMTNKKLIDAVNRSGFPLQIGLENLVNKTHSKHGWRVIYSEHSWKNPADGCSGFIDLILEDHHGTSVLVVESKRVIDTSWIFLIDDPKQLSRRHAKSWMMYYVKNKLTYFGLKELALEPTTPQSQYCVVDGQDPKAKPMLERIGSDLVSSSEGFANEEREVPLKDIEAFRMYFNVIVTTAKLQVCSFDPTNTSVKDGTVQNAKFTEVPFLRFRKQLAYQYSVPERPSFYDYGEIARAKESTVFVVHGEAFPDFLCQFQVDDRSLRGVV